MSRLEQSEAIYYFELLSTQFQENFMYNLDDNDKKDFHLAKNKKEEFLVLVLVLTDSSCLRSNSLHMLGFGYAYKISPYLRTCVLD